MSQRLLHPRSYLILAIATLVFVGLVTATATLTQANGNPNPGISPINSKPGGQSYSQRAAAWWQWSLGIPAANNPMLDITGEDCGLGQSGKVWFLAGTWGGNPGPFVQNELVKRECTVSTGTRLFFPIMSQVYATLPELGDDPNIALEEMLALIAFNDVDAIEMNAEIDGLPLHELNTYRAFSEEAFDVWLPEDNVWDLVTELFGLGSIIGEGTHSPNATDGFWLMVEPLSKGVHVISLDGSLDGFVLSKVEYTIKVK